MEKLKILKNKQNKTSETRDNIKRYNINVIRILGEKNCNAKIYLKK